MTDPVARKRYVEAFERSDFDAMLNYYKRNYPAAIGAASGRAAAVPEGHGAGADVPRSRRIARCTGTDSPGTWDWVEKDLTIVTIPGAGHFVQQDAAELVTSTMQWWLAMRVRADVVGFFAPVVSKQGQRYKIGWPSAGPASSVASLLPGGHSGPAGQASLE